MRTSNEALQASLLIALSALLYGFLGILGTRVLEENLSISAMLFWRFIIAGFWIFAWARADMELAVLKKLDKRNLFLILSLGAIGYSGSSAFYFFASEYTGTGLAMVIFFSYPMIIALGSWLLHKKSLGIKTLSLLTAMSVGLILLQNNSLHQFSIIGINFGLIAAICYAFYILGCKHISTNTIYSLSPNMLTVVVCLGSAFIFLPFIFTSNNFWLPHTLRGWCYLLALGIFATAIPIQLMFQGLKHISSLRASIISVLEPLVTLIIGIFLLQESVSTLQLIGVLIIISSAILVQFQREI